MEKIYEFQIKGICREFAGKLPPKKLQKMS